MMANFLAVMSLQVHIFVYWCWRGSLCDILFWLYWSSNTEWMLSDLCILITHAFHMYWNMNHYDFRAAVSL